LQGYKHDYTKTLQDRLQGGLSSSDTRNYQDFISNLEKALGQQYQLLGKLKNHYEMARNVWMQHQQRLTSLNTLVQRQQARANLRQSRQDQKMMDEYGARAFARRETASL